MTDLPAGRVYIAKPGTEPGDNGWTYIGETAGGVQFAPAPEVPDAGEPPFRRLSDAILSITVDYSDAKAEFRRLVRLICRLTPGSHSHCRTCHPEMAPRPLAVNGDDYRRRQLARTRRRR